MVADPVDPRISARDRLDPARPVSVIGSVVGCHDKGEPRQKRHIGGKNLVAGAAKIQLVYCKLLGPVAGGELVVQMTFSVFDQNKFVRVKTDKSVCQPHTRHGIHIGHCGTMVPAVLLGHAGRVRQTAHKTKVIQTFKDRIGAVCAIIGKDDEIIDPDQMAIGQPFQNEGPFVLHWCDCSDAHPCSSCLRANRLNAIAHPAKGGPRSKAAFNQVHPQRRFQPFP